MNGNAKLNCFPSQSQPAKRPSYPEATGLRHLAFAVQAIEETVSYLEQQAVSVEEIRGDPFTDKKFTFFAERDGLPIEIYES